MKHNTRRSVRHSRQASPIAAALLIAFLAIAGCRTAKTTPAAIANPAAEYCEEQGYVHEVLTAEDGSQSGLCTFPDGSECGAWDYYRGNCGPLDRGETAQLPVPSPSQSDTGSETDFVEHDCPFGAPPDQTFTCGYVTVPEDHTAPEGPTIRIAVAILHDRSDGHVPDPILLLAGGPGEKVVHKAPAIAQALGPVRANRDFVIFDQRGTGLSEPALECPEIAEATVALMAEPDLNIALRETFDATMACRDRLRDEGHNLAVYTTVQNAADVDAIRIALGYDQVNLYGGSYGSLLAQVTMRDHPQGIRSAVLESVVPLDASLLVDTIATVPQTLLSIVDACAADAECNGAFPDLRKVLLETIDQMNAEPVPVQLTDPRNGDRHPALLTGDALVGILRGVFYQTQAIPLVPQAIYDIRAGDYTIVTRLAGLRPATIEAVSQGMRHSVLCAGDLVGRAPDEISSIRAGLPPQLAGTAYPGTVETYGAFGICENWPGSRSGGAVRDLLVSSIPTLLLSGEFDPVTPPEYGRRVAAGLEHGTFVELPAGGHAGENTTACATSVTAAFLAQPLETLDLSCVSEMPALSFDIPVGPAAANLMPYTSKELRIEGVVPVGWREVQPGTFARLSSSTDIAALQLIVVAQADPGAVLADMSKGYGLDKVPQLEGEHRTQDLVWSLYTIDSQGAARALALAESETGTLAIVVRSAPEEYDELHRSVFLPMVDALIPLAAQS